MAIKNPVSVSYSGAGINVYLPKEAKVLLWTRLHLHYTLKDDVLRLNFSRDPKGFYRVIGSTSPTYPYRVIVSKKRIPSSWKEEVSTFRMVTTEEFEIYPDFSSGRGPVIRIDLPRSRMLPSSGPRTHPNRKPRTTTTSPVSVDPYHELDQALRRLNAILASDKVGDVTFVAKTKDDQEFVFSPTKDTLKKIQAERRVVFGISE